MSVGKEEFIKTYSEAIREGNAALFAGAGLSRSSGFVNWKELLRPLADSIRLDIDKETDFLTIDQYYRNERGNRANINQTIMDAFTKNVEINENVKILTHLPIFTYWTTNYDNLLEEGIRNANRNPDVKSESDQLSVIKRDRDAVVYKMHGDANRPANAVLTKYDYETYDKSRSLFRVALRGDLVSKTFLFIGFSFEDPNLDYILGQIHSLLDENVREHYCFFKKVQRSDYSTDEEYGYDAGKQTMREQNLRNYGIQTVFVNSYEEITEILQQVERSFKRSNVFISGSAASYSASWDKTKAEEFAGKLAASLVKENYKITSGFGLGIGSSVLNGALDVIYGEKYRHVDEYLTIRPFPQNISDPTERAHRWKKYREDMLSETGVSIFIFGNKEVSGKIVDADGMLQEFNIAKAKGNIIIPVGSTGYAAKTITEEIKKDITSYPYLIHYIDTLEASTDIQLIIETILKIIKESG